jgi:hypothetical protein
LFEDFGVSISMPTPLLFDSVSSISIARDLINHDLTKHIDIYYTGAQFQDDVIAL